MARTKKVTREAEIQSILEDARIYSKKLQPQIALVVRLEKLVERINAELAEQRLLMIETKGKEQDEHAIVNPLLPYLITLEKNLQAAYASLGLNYNINPQNISKDDDESDGIDDLYRL